MISFIVIDTNCGNNSTDNGGWQLRTSYREESGSEASSSSSSLSEDEDSKSDSVTPPYRSRLAVAVLMPPYSSSLAGGVLVVAAAPFPLPIRWPTGPPPSRLLRKDSEEMRLRDMVGGRKGNSQHLTRTKVGD